MIVKGPNQLGLSLLKVPILGGSGSRGGELLALKMLMKLIVPMNKVIYSATRARGETFHAALFQPQT